MESGGVILGILLGKAAAGGSGFPVLLCTVQVSVLALLVLLVDQASRRRIQAYFERLDLGHPVYYLKYQVKHPSLLPLSATQMKRLEARITSELRVTDYCFAPTETTLLIVLKVLSQSLKGIEGRLEAVFQAEGVLANQDPDHGQFIKVPSERAHLRLQSA